MARALAGLPFLALALRLFGFRRCRAWLACRQPQRAALPEQHIPQLAQAVRCAANISLWPVDCLPQALWLWHELRCRGVAGELQFGVMSKRADSLTAHAWVEIDGVPLNEPRHAAELYPPFVAAFDAK
jgi:hypothetical protein